MWMDTQILLGPFSNTLPLWYNLAPMSKALISKKGEIEQCGLRDQMEELLSELVGRIEIVELHLIVILLLKLLIQFSNFRKLIYIWLKTSYFFLGLIYTNCN